MRVGLIAPPWVAVPPGAYGGTEAVIDLLARGLSANGHDVLLFTVGTSRCPVRRRHLFERPATPLGDGILEAAHVIAAFDELTAADVDVIHDHTMLGALVGPGGNGARGPAWAVTHHGTFTPETRRLLRRAAAKAAVVAISHDQAGRAGDVPIAAVIPHAVDLRVHRPGSRAAVAGTHPYLAFVGRMAPEKGVDRAIRIARRAGLPLHIAAKMQQPAEHAYFETRVKPLLRPGDPEPAELGISDRIRLVQGAYALLNPIDWPEPFGLVMAESLAMGTPVVAFRRGAAAEIVDDRVTGFLVADEDEAVAAVHDVRYLRRSRCRSQAEQRFSVQRFVEDHVRLYRRIIAASSMESDAVAVAPAGLVAS